MATTADQLARASAAIDNLGTVVKDGLTALTTSFQAEADEVVIAIKAAAGPSGIPPEQVGALADRVDTMSSNFAAGIATLKGTIDAETAAITPKVVAPPQVTPPVAP